MYEYLCTWYIAKIKNEIKVFHIDHQVDLPFSDFGATKSFKTFQEGCNSKRDPAVSAYQLAQTELRLIMLTL